MLKDHNARTAAREDFESNIALSAGAGSGKTTVLVSRYLAILKRDLAKVPQIVAVTFTEKAAKEMRDRIRSECRQRARRATDAAARQRWQRHERELESAPVSTIHSLCMRILREHAIVAGADPHFTVLDEAQAGLLMADTARRYALRRVHEDAAPMRQLVAAYGVEGLRKILCDLIAERDKWLEWLHGMEDAESFVRQRLGADTEAQQGALEGLVQDARWQEAIATLGSAEPLDPEDRAAQQRAAILELAPVAASAELDIQQRVTALTELQTHCKKFGSKAKWPSPEALAAVQDAFVTLRELCRAAMKQALGATDADVAASSAQLSGALAVELEGAREQYQKVKRQRSVMDFADLQLGARDLLRDRPEVRNKYQRQFSYIMVDEFQDTNALQKEILFALAGAGPQQCGAACQAAEQRSDVTQSATPGKAAWPTPGKLFIVGDDKQSIYRFRGADVRVFNVVRGQFASSDSARTLQLSANFRSQPGLVNFYNDLFARDCIMGTGEAEQPYIARYSPLTAERDAGSDQPDVEIILATADAEIPAEENEADDLALDDLREIEAAALAGRIEEICADGGFTVFERVDDRAETAREARHGDVAILFRALKSVRIYERALRQRGIPYYLVAGQGLYGRQEVSDLLCLLRALENTRDEVALIGALRSPLFSLSDETLYRLCRRRQPYEALQKIAAGADDEQLARIGPDEREKACRAAEMLGELRRVKDRLSVSQLLTTAVEQTGFLGALLAQFNGEQMASNVRKLIDVAAAFERGGLFSLHEFIGYLRDLIATEQREGEAPIQGEEENVVKLLTIHRAKGLQWPIVIVPDLGRKPPIGGGEWLWDEAHGLILRGEDSTGRRHWPAVGKRARSREDDMEDAERRRLLYVACTRARDHLILSSPWKPTKSGRPSAKLWIAWIAEALGIDGDTPDGPLATSDGAGWTGVLRSFGPKDIDTSRRGRRRKSMAGRHETELRSCQPLPGAAGEEEFVTQTRPLRAAAADQQRFTVTRLATYLACPREYELRYVLDLPEYSPRSATPPIPPASGGEAAGRSVLLSPLERGTVAHRCLQRIGREKEEDIDAVVEGCLREFGLAPAADESVRREIASMVHAFLETDLFQLIRSAKRLRTEALFSMPLDGCLVEGQVDAAAWDAEGMIHLIDYKTGRGDQRQMQRYRFQLALYCAAIEAAFGAPPASATLYQLEQAESRALRLPEDMSEAVSKALSAIEGIRAGRFPRGEAVDCTRCGHAWVCRAPGPGP